jgi:hypothetical protein
MLTQFRRSTTLFPWLLLGPLLSFEPESFIQEPADEPPTTAISSLDQIPEWYFEKPQRNQQGVLLVVKTGPFSSPAAADDALPAAIRETVQSYLSQTVGQPGTSLDFSDEQLEAWIVGDHRKSRRFGELLAEKYGVDPQQYFAFAQILLDQAITDSISQKAEARRIEKRLKWVALSLAGILGSIGIIWGWLTIDQATRGFYSKTLLRIALVIGLFLLAGLGLLIRLI